MNTRQRGVALLMVLLILALMMVLASAMTERSARMYQQTATTLDNLQAKWYALGAETLAAALLQRDALDSPNQTHLAQNRPSRGDVLRSMTARSTPRLPTLRPASTSTPLTSSAATKALKSLIPHRFLPDCWRTSAASRCAPYS